MGFKSAELTTTTPTATQPTGRMVMCKAFQITRSNTTAAIRAVLPANASLVGVQVYSPAVSDAGTTATVSVGTSSNANEIVSAQDVKTAAGMLNPSTAVATTFVLTETLPSGADKQIYAKYAETGTASAAGGPFTVFLHYVL